MVPLTGNGGPGSHGSTGGAGGCAPAGLGANTAPSAPAMASTTAVISRRDKMLHLSATQTRSCTGRRGWRTRCVPWQGRSFHEPQFSQPLLQAANR